MRIATFDIGTTAVKAVAVDEAGEAVYTGSAPVHTIPDGEHREQDPEEWYRAFLALSRELLDACGPETVGAVICSGQMQDVICVGENGRAVQNAILYSDGRAAFQAEEILHRAGLLEPAGRGGTSESDVLAAGASLVERVTGNHFDGSMPLAKMLWLREQRPEVFAKTKKFLISSKDYVNLRLTGRAAGDVTACSTAGCMDLAKKEWSEELLALAGVKPECLPELFCSHEPVGTVTAEAAAESGYREGTAVYAGTGDAGATTLASGILSPGEYNINLGTTCWVAAVSEDCMESAGGGFNLASMEPGKYINVVPFFNGGNVHKLMAELFSADGTADYAHISELLRHHVPGSRGVSFLPYINGERFPVVDSRVRGTYLGVSPSTTAADLAGSALEGVAFSVRQGLETLGTPPVKLTLIGGGAREEAWCRILCDVMGTKLFVYRKPDLLPSLAIAAAVLWAQGKIGGYQDFIDSLAARGDCRVFAPDPENSRLYDGLYRAYQRIYPAVKGLYAEM